MSSGLITEKTLSTLIENIENGFIEIGIHPGFPIEKGCHPFLSSKFRSMELEALLSTRVKDKIREHEIKLISFHDLPTK